MSIGLAFLLMVGVTEAGEPPPAELVGTWEVAHVAVKWLTSRTGTTH